MFMSVSASFCRDAKQLRLWRRRAGGSSLAAGPLESTSRQNPPGEEFRFCHFHAAHGEGQGCRGEDADNTPLSISNSEPSTSSIVNAATLQLSLARPDTEPGWHHPPP